MSFVSGKYEICGYFVYLEDVYVGERNLSLKRRVVVRTGGGGEAGRDEIL
jgi:hypothetical protein